LHVRADGQVLHGLLDEVEFRDRLAHGLLRGCCSGAGETAASDDNTFAPSLALAHVARTDEATEAAHRSRHRPATHHTWKTASNAWTIVTTLLKTRVSAKRRDLRMRRDDPADGMRGPERGEAKAKT